MTKEDYIKAVDRLFDKATAYKVKLNFNPSCYKPERLDCLWYGGNVATIYVDKDISIDISAIGDVRAIYYNKKGEEEARVKDSRNGGYFENEMSKYLANDNELLQAIEEDRLVLGNNNWLEYDGYIRYRGERYFIDLGMYDNITDSNNILEAIDEVLDNYKLIKKAIKSEFYDGKMYYM